MQEEQQVKKKAKVITFKLLAMLGLLIVVLGIFAFITDEVVLEKEDIFDTKVITFFSQFASAGAISVMRFFTLFGSTGVLIPAYLLIIVWMWRINRKWHALNVAITAAGAWLMMRGLKLFFQRSRPETSVLEKISGYSFPSGHSVSAMVFFSLLIYTTWKSKLRRAYKVLLTVFFILFAIMVAVSRIMLGVHYPSDVIAGLCLGSAWVIISTWVLNKINGHRLRGEYE